MKVARLGLSMVCGLLWWGAGLQTASAQDSSAVVSRVASADGRILSFYPISTPLEVIEGPYFSCSTDCFIAFPENYAETGRVVDALSLSTREGVPIIIEHEWTWGNPSGVNVRGANEGRTLPRDGLVSYTLLTTSGPPVLIELHMQNGHIANRKFHMTKPVDAIGPAPTARPSTNSLFTVD